MSLPLPPECWPLQLDDVVVLIGASPSSRRRKKPPASWQKGRLDTPSGTPMTATTT